ncbi:hypothetical protein SC10_B2orf05146 [Bacillus paralicheniformis]|nr:hypothetical protein SC10_B2orf05146 [Bacillus paralicheniformis]
MRHGFSHASSTGRAKTRGFCFFLKKKKPAAGAALQPYPLDSPFTCPFR